jgi:hypothetical protein
LAAVGAALYYIMMELCQYQDNSLSASILEIIQAPTSPNTKESPSAVPTLKAYGVSDLVILNRKHDKSNTLFCKIRNDFTSSFIHIPWSKGYIQMKENAWKVKWLPDVLMALGGPGNDHESLLDVLTYIGQNEEYEATWGRSCPIQRNCSFQSGMVLPSEPYSPCAT